MDGFNLPVADHTANASWQENQASILELIMQGAPLPEVLDSIAASLEQAVQASFQAAILPISSTGTLQTGTALWLTPGFQEVLQQLSLDSLTSTHPEGYIHLSLQDNPIAWASIQPEAFSIGLHACALFPIHNQEEQTIACIVIGLREARRLQRQEIQPVRLTTTTIRLAFSYSRNEERTSQLQEREKIAREQVNLAEGMSQMAVDGAGAGTFHVNLDDNYITYSPLFCRIMTGRDQPGMSRNALVTYIHPDDRPIREAAYEEANRTGHLQYEARVVWEDGSIHWIKAVGTYLTDAEGRRVHFSGIILDITPEIKAREEQQKLLSLIDNSVDFMGIADTTGRMIYLNEAGKTMLGIPPDTDITTIRNRDLLPADELQRLTTEVYPVVVANGRWSGTIRVRHLATGEVFPCNADYISIRDPRTGEVLGRGVCLRDLRPELAARSALEQSEQRFRHMIERAPIAIGVMKGEDMIIEVANDKLKEIWGKSGPMAGRPLLDILPEIKDQPFPELMREVMRTGIPHYGFETKASLVRNGELGDYYFNFVYAPFKEGDTITGIQLVASEVTAQVLTKKELEASEERFRNLIHSAPVPIAIYTGMEMRILIANETVLATWGRDASVIGQTFLEALPELEGTPWMAELQKVYTTGIPFEAKEQQVDLVISGKLQLHYFNFTYKPLRDGAGNIYGVINTAADVTSLVLARQQLQSNEQELERQVLQRTEELSRSNQQLTQSNEELEQFAYVASHDLQEPLRKIRIFSDLLQGQLTDNAAGQQAQAYLQKVMASAERMSNLIMDLLNFSRITRKQDLIEQVDLNTVLQQVKVDFELLIRQKEATIHLHNLPVIDSIPLQMNQLFYNLTGNALKFTATGRKPVITIEARPATPEETAQHLPHTVNEQYTLITVTDNGIGFEPEMAGQIFTIFQRLHTRHRFEGTGIGLALCKRIVQAHGGAIWATAVQHEGAVFSLLLPLKQV